METGLKSRLLPHRRVLITIPDRTAFGKRGLDFQPRGSGGFSTRSLNSRGCGSQGGGQGCQDKPTENGRGCALIFIQLHNVHGLGPRTREQPIKIHSVNCKMWNRGLESLPRGGNVCRGGSPSPLAVFPLTVRNTNLNKRNTGFGFFLSSLLLGEEVLSPGNH